MTDDRNDPLGEKTTTYEVGYGKPPKATQFRPGVSGNPKGRPRGKRRLGDALEVAFNRRVNVHGRPGKTMSSGAALLQNLMARAIGGNLAAAKLVLEHKARTDNSEPAWPEVEIPKTVVIRTTFVDPKDVVRNRDKGKDG